MGGLRLRYRVLWPLALTGVALAAGIAVALTTFFLIDRHVEANAEAETRRLASTLARALAQPVLRKDVWQAYQLVRAATDESAAPTGEPAVQMVVLDADEHVFVSPVPRTYPIGTHLSRLPPRMVEAARVVMGEATHRAARVGRAGDPWLIIAVPVLGNEDELLGVVLASHPAGISRAQRAAVVQRLAALGLVAVVLVAMAGGALGLRLTEPLDRLREAMRQTPHHTPVREQRASPELAAITQRQDEIGDLARTFVAMLGQIAVKQELERHMLEAERLARIGQFTAGIAHEVNNPLGGMIAAIQNRRLRGDVDERTQRTLAMLERGLHQIYETVQALLNESRRGQRDLQEADLHDLEVLLRPEAEQLRCLLRWQPQPLPDGVGLPAVSVRQVLLNLVLNALAAAGERGRVEVWSCHDDHTWQVCVGNTGPALNEADLDAMLQGSRRAEDGRMGLGLWMTGRLLHDFGGRLQRQALPERGLSTVLVASFPFCNPAGTPFTGPMAAVEDTS